MLGLLVQAPQQGRAAEEQEGHTHRGGQDDGDSPGQGSLCGDGTEGCVTCCSSTHGSRDLNTIPPSPIQWKSRQAGPSAHLGRGEEVPRESGSRIQAFPARVTPSYLFPGLVSGRTADRQGKSKQEPWPVSLPIPRNLFCLEVGNGTPWGPRAPVKHTHCSVLY